MKTRARAQQLSQSFDDLHNSQLVQGLQTPSTPKTPQTSGRSKQKNPLWQLLSSHRSFWDIIRDSCDDQSGSKPSSFGDDDITAIMNRLNQQVSHQFDSYKYEDSGFLSSSPSGYDPRETMPINEAEVEDLRVAIWPTLQHLVELTKSRPLLPHPKDCYLTQLRHVRGQLRDTWQNKGFPGNPPSPFQLEAWTGGITNWRTSYYTNGEDRFPASHVETQIEAWCLEAPSTPANDVSRASDDDASDNEIFHARHEFDHNNASPTLGHSYRRVMSALYDANRDVGLPTASQIQAYQSGATPTTTIPSNSMTDTGMSSPNNVSVFLPRRPVRILEDQQTPPPSSDDATALVAAGNMSPSSNKENDNDLLFRMDREQRERERTPSSSQDVINPAGERMARSERLGEEWEIEREWEYDGDCA
ncbi:MAG: hypothetical protein LQ343_000174 [Gyalolechia ehrenbergii]|nr:MAG: hypothetical protein LQ343_000174 [Gyalolechia ehrenbergii]